MHEDNATTWRRLRHRTSYLSHSLKTGCLEIKRAAPIHGWDLDPMQVCLVLLSPTVPTGTCPEAPILPLAALSKIPSSPLLARALSYRFPCRHAGHGAMSHQIISKNCHQTIELRGKTCRKGHHHGTRKKHRFPEPARCRRRGLPFTPHPLQPTLRADRALPTRHLVLATWKVGTWQWQDDHSIALP